MQVLRSRGDDLISWTPEGDVSIRGEPIRRVNFTDLLSGVVRSRPSMNIPPPYERFLKALAEANIPETIIKNKSSIMKCHQLQHVKMYLILGANYVLVTGRHLRNGYIFIVKHLCK